jgi:nucleotide-binding universal stress UspA family protein
VLAGQRSVQSVALAEFGIDRDRRGARGVGNAVGWIAGTSYIYSNSTVNGGERLRLPIHVSGRHRSATHRSEEAVFKEIIELADRYDRKVRTAMGIVAADDAILKEARRGKYDLIILGMTRRPGETLFFGNMASAVLESTDLSILFVAS